MQALVSWPHHLQSQVRSQIERQCDDLVLPQILKVSRRQCGLFDSHHFGVDASYPTATANKRESRDHQDHKVDCGAPAEESRKRFDRHAIALCLGAAKVVSNYWLQIANNRLYYSLRAMPGKRGWAYASCTDKCCIKPVI